MNGNREKLASNVVGSKSNIVHTASYSSSIIITKALFIRTVTSQFFVRFKNGFLNVLWCCLDTMLKKVKVLLTKAVTLTVRVNEVSVQMFRSINE